MVASITQVPCHCNVLEKGCRSQALWNPISPINYTRAHYVSVDHLPTGQIFSYFINFLEGFTTFVIYKILYICKHCIYRHTLNFCIFKLVKFTMCCIVCVLETLDENQEYLFEHAVSEHLVSFRTCCKTQLEKSSRCMSSQTPIIG